MAEEFTDDMERRFGHRIGTRIIIPHDTMFALGAARVRDTLNSTVGACC